MGAWGALPFDNSRAADWVYSLSETSNLSLVQGALARLEDSGAAPVEPDIIYEAIAACEVVARLHGNRSYENEFSDLVDHWIARHSIAGTPDLVKRARGAVRRVLSQSSELQALRRDMDRYDWHAALIALDGRLAT